MRIYEIINEADDITMVIDPKSMARAATEGFDTSKVWFHGTRRKFSSFRLPKGSGIDELGRGVYVTKFAGTANVWAQGSGLILACVLAEGKLIELSKLSSVQLWFSGPDDDDRGANPLWREVYRGYTTYMDEMGEDVLPYQEFAKSYNRHEIKLSDCLSSIGYIGATHRNSQIAGQAIIWSPANIKIVGKAKGYDGWLSKTSYDQPETIDEMQLGSSPNLITNYRKEVWKTKTLHTSDTYDKFLKELPQNKTSRIRHIKGNHLRRAVSMKRDGEPMTTIATSCRTSPATLERLFNLMPEELKP